MAISTPTSLNAIRTEEANCNTLPSTFSLSTAIQIAGQVGVWNKMSDFSGYSCSAASDYISVNPKKASFTYDGYDENNPTVDHIDIDVGSNTSWEVVISYTTGSDWLTVNPTSGSNNGTITLTVTTNTGAERDATVIVQKVGDASIHDDISVLQRRDPSTPA